MQDDAAIRLARELDAICERNAADVEFVALCERLLLHLGEIAKSRVALLDRSAASGRAPVGIAQRPETDMPEQSKRGRGKTSRHPPE